MDWARPTSVVLPTHHIGCFAFPLHSDAGNTSIRMKPKSTLESFLIACASLLVLSSAQGANIYWDGTSASWNSAANWSTAAGADTPDPANVPGILDDAIFNITSVNGTEAITLDANQAAKSLTFNNNAGTTTLT